MNTQHELTEFFWWCESNLRQFYIEHCDESDQFYLGDVCIGGWAGDTQQFYMIYSNECAAALRMMNVATDADCRSI
ncbi:MAG: hypothetical protein ACRC1W_13465 [Shewanella sp.]